MILHLRGNWPRPLRFHSLPAQRVLLPAIQSDSVFIHGFPGIGRHIYRPLGSSVGGGFWNGGRVAPRNKRRLIGVSDNAAW